MSRYFFNIVEGHSKTLLRDSEGAEFSTLEEARTEAVGLARDIAKHNFPTQTWRIVVSNENGDEVLAVFLSEIRTHKIPEWFDLSVRIAKLKASLGRRPFVWVMAAALLGILAQATVMILVREESGSYQTASAPIEGPFVAVRFVPHASVADINKFLDAYRATIVGGPLPGGFYRVRMVGATVPQEELKKIVGRMAQEKVVEFAAPAQ